MQETLLSALHCGYDTDCTLATAAALLGQILGAKGIPASLKEPVGDELVMGISYHRPEMTLSALARDTVRVGTLLSRELSTGVTVLQAPRLKALPAQPAPTPRLRVEYEGLPCAAPGESVRVLVHIEGQPPEDGAELALSCPQGWQALPEKVRLSPVIRQVQFTLYADPATPAMPMRNLFTLRLGQGVEHTFGIAGAGLWRFLGVYFDPLPPEGDALAKSRAFQHHFVSFGKEYLPEPGADVPALYHRWSHVLGRPAVVVARERCVELKQLTGLQGEYAAYLSRTVISPDERQVYLVVGHNDGYRLFLNGELVAEADEQLWWEPFNSVHLVCLKKGENHLFLKLLKRGEELKWSLGIRETARPGHHNVNDWCVDLADRNPLTEL